MDRETIIRMADESGLDHMPGWLTLPAVLANLERFAHLVAAAEREACAQMCDEEKLEACWHEDAHTVAAYLASVIRARCEE